MRTDVMRVDYRVLLRNMPKELVDNYRRVIQEYEKNVAELREKDEEFRDRFIFFVPEADIILN